MTDITIPKLNNNDDSYVLVQWLFEDGEELPPGEPIAVVETSKAAEELECETGGFLHRLAAERDDCRPGDVIGRIFATEEERRQFVAAQAKPDAGPEVRQLVITEAAKALIARHGIREDALRVLGKTVIKTGDVERLVADSGKPAVASVSKRQQAVADVVTESHRTIPAAFTVTKVNVGSAVDAAKAASERESTLIGLVELLVKAVGGLRAEFPAFYHAGTGVGVTVDVGKGLFIPVVPDPAEKSVAAIADILMEHRIKAMRSDFSERDFAGAGITVSLSTDEGVLFAQPIVFPGQTAMVSLGSTMRELVLAEDGAVVQARIAHIGVAFDHRVINGRDAAQFLSRLAAVLADADRLVKEG
ncbi:2-oxo acid dehydrogenase subunit E2 (plasmid) [Streptomyces sp. NBC_01136]|uniref:2-oxo acid dehydrogenase subunit E2 n=1 Tax=unclassified Streptomyces TaxID=2593676 RepID=UPI002F90FB80|nr:2-oxo acid dehydrogenase subunit E2 [Streptomyces sp. NBC_01136]